MDVTWWKSSYSVANSACVEVAVADGGASVLMRDSKNPSAAVLTYSRESWGLFIDDIRTGRLRRP